MPDALWAPPQESPLLIDDGGYAAIISGK